MQSGRVGVEGSRREINSLHSVWYSIMSSVTVVPFLPWWHCGLRGWVSQQGVIGSRQECWKGGGLGAGRILALRRS